MYILIDYRLILTNDTKKRDPTSRQRGHPLAGLRWWWPAATANYRLVLSSEMALQNNNLNCLKENLKEKEKLVAGPRWAPDSKTDWPTDCRSSCDFDFENWTLELLWHLRYLDCVMLKKLLTDAVNCCCLRNTLKCFWDEKCVWNCSPSLYSLMLCVSFKRNGLLW
jgi:hypothetical protein